MNRRGFLLLLALLGWNPALAAPVSPLEVVRSTSEQMLDRLRAERSLIEAEPARLYGLVEDIVLPHFDFRRMAQWVLGKYWRRATPEERERFTSEFRTLLVRTYSTALLDYTDQEIHYLPLKLPEGASDATVRTEVVQPGGPPIPIDYRMYWDGSEWKVYDVAINGVSLVANYRSTFAAEIRQRGLDALIARLAERNRDGTL